MKRISRAVCVLFLAVLLSAVLYAQEGAGDAKAEQAAPRKMLEMFQSGGLVMWGLLATSVAGMTFAMERLVGLRKKQHLPGDLCVRVNWLLEHENVDSAIGYAKEDGSTLGRALSAVLGRCDGDRKEMDSALEDELSRALWDERRNVRPVGIVATITPLMGLLGTVIGMIEAFRQAAEKGMDNPAAFAGGIYQALYTTAFGLMISIPFLLLYHYLRGKTEHIMRQVEDETLKFICDLYENHAEYESEVDTSEMAA